MRRLRAKLNLSWGNADDLALTSETPQDLHTMLNIAGKIATRADLKFNPLKCATLHVDSKCRKAIPTRFQIQYGVPEPLAEIDVYENLGVPTGYHVANSAERALENTESCRKLVTPC
jgi:hypothetical protein